MKTTGVSTTRLRALRAGWMAVALLIQGLACAQALPVLESLSDCAQALNTVASIYPKPPAAQSLAYHARAFELCKAQKGNDHVDTLDSMRFLAMDYRALARHDEALPLFEEVLKHRRAMLGATDAGTLITINNLAGAYSALGLHAQAAALYEEEVNIRRARPGETLLTLNIMNNLAQSHLAIGRHGRALQLFDEIVNVRRAEQGFDHPDTQLSMANLAVGYSTVGRHSEAIVLEEQMLRWSRATLGADDAGTLTAMSNLAESYREAGRYGEALALNEETLTRRRTKLGPDHPATLRSMNNLGGSYIAVGRHREALALFGEGLQRLRATLGPDHPTVLTGMNNLAAVYSELERHDEALPLKEETLRLRRIKLGQDHPDTLGSMNNLAATYQDLMRFEEALVLNEQTLQSRRALLGPGHPRVLTSMSNLALSYRNVRRNEAAVQLDEAVLELKKQRLGPEHPGTLVTMHNLAQSYDSVGRLRDTLALGRAYIAGAEQQRGQKGLSTGEQQTLFADYANSYRQFSRYFGRLAQDKLPQDNERKALLEEGFEIADRAKARTLIESISRQDAGRAGGLSADDQQSLERLSVEAVFLEQAIAKQEDLSKPDSEILRNLQTRKREVDAQYRNLQDKFKAAYPKYARLLEVKFARPADARQLLSAGQLVISFVIENKGSISAWLLDQSGEPRFVDLGEHKSLRDNLNRLRQQISDSDERPVSPELLHNLSAILIHPLLEHLSSSKRWIIIPDGDLALLPFDALLLPGGEALISQHEISVVQSWSLYALLKQREADYSKLKREKNLLAVGNAVYETVSPGAADAIAIPATVSRGRYRSSAALPLEPAGSLREQAERYAMQNLIWSNLPGTAREIAAVSDIFGAGVDIYTGIQASEAQMQLLNRSGKLTDYRYLLFSAHGYLASNPALSSLVLSQHQRTPAADGYITAAEWPGYDIRSDLTVFSACDTGVGKTLSGEGVMGLPYALFVAGNKNTLLTLWPVDDRATAEFMRRFFSRLAKGEAQIAALIETKREMAAHSRWNAPLYWAGFVLYGV